jgi:pyruvate/2-oxoglutarate dehydrogenase complex dihydrolipoamide dehydrogenase (E3) component
VSFGQSAICNLQSRGEARVAEQFDLVVIGTGQAGGPLASEFARAGRRVAAIERAHVGGTCVNVGCTPTKTMVASARVAAQARRSAEYGVDTGPVQVAMERVRKRKRAMVERWRSGSEGSLVDSGAELIRGEARFTAAKSLAVRLEGGEERALTAETIVINTGARPATPELPGLDALPFLDSTSIMELDSVPERLIVLGGGYIGLEFGQMFRRFGAEVTIVQHGPQLLGREDPDIAGAVAEILQDDGISVLLNTRAVRAAGGPRAVRLTVEAPDGGRTLEGSHLLVATGRRPNSDALDLATAGIAADKRGNISVNERLETSVAGVYAAGDVTGGPAFTHISYDDFRILRANLLHGEQRSTSGRIVPYTVYIDPQLGRVGLSEGAAREAGRKVKVATLEMSGVARALETGESRGLMKAVVDADSDLILGAAVLGMEGGEIMSMLQIAMMGKLPYGALKDGVFAHPSLAESLNNLFAQL